MKKIDRLINRGLSPATAMRVIKGELIENEAVRVAMEAHDVEQFLAMNDCLPEGLRPNWDFSPHHFYFALDGHDKSDPRFQSLELIEADFAEILPMLTFQSTRDEGPWSKAYRRKTAKTAYRWQMGLSVTPPLITVCESELHIEGGLHRFHLAYHLTEEKIPLLVDAENVDRVRGMLPSAKPLGLSE